MPVLNQMATASSRTEQPAPGPQLQPARRAGPRVSGRAALWAFAAGEVVAFVLWLSLGRTEWFSTDEWEYLADRTAFDPGDLLREHYTHWTAVPILIYRFLWWVFGIGSYMPYLVVLVALHVTAAALLRAIMRRAGVDAWIATAAALAFVFFGSGYQNIVWAFQIGFVGALVFGLVHLVLADHDGPVDRRDLLGLLAGLASIASAGVGVTLVGATTLAVLIRRGWRGALLHGGPLGAIYLAWWSTFSRGKDHPGVDTRDVTPDDVAEFVNTGIQRAFGNLGQLTGVGLLIGVLFVCGLVLAWARLDRATLRRRGAAPAALAVGAVGFLVFSGTGRVGLLGADFAGASRYQHIVVALLLPAIAVAFDAFARRWRVMVPVGCTLLLLGVPGNIDTLADYTRTREARNRTYRHLILAIPRTEAAQTVPRNVRPDSGHPATRKITVGWLLDGAASGRIPDPGPISAGDEARIRFRLSFLQRDGDESRASGCRKVDTGLPWRFERGDQIYIESRGTLKIVPAPDTVPGSVNTFFSPANGSRLVAVSGPVDVVLQQKNPYLAVTVCEYDG